MNAVPTIWQRVRYTALREMLRGQFGASLDWRLVLAEAKLPAELEEAVTKTVRATRLWQREKVSVAQELVAHFQDGLEAGRDVTVLATTFGDAQQAAQLIRRAKKRNRPIWWHIWHVVWIMAVVLIATYLAIGLWMMTGRPNVATDYLKLLTADAAAVPEVDCAWPLYREALLAMGANLNDPDSPFLTASGAAPGEANWADTEKFLNEHQQSISQLRVAASRKDLGFVAVTSQAKFSPADQELFGYQLTPQQLQAAQSETLADRWLISTLIPHINLLRLTASLLANDERRAVAAGEGEAALADVLAMLGVSHHCEETPFLVSLLVANAAQGQAFDAIERTLMEKPGLWNDEQLRELAHRVAASQIDWRSGIAAERAGFYDILQRFYTDDGNGNGRLAFRGANDQNLFQMLEALTSGQPSQNSALANTGWAMLAMPVANMAVASRKESTETYERFADWALEHIEKPLWKSTEGPTFDDQVKILEHGLLSKYRTIFMRLLVPAYDGVRNSIAAANGRRDGVLIGLALELYHREHGDWPKKLDELSPRWLPTLPVDGITGRPLHYKIVDDQPLVYSVGVDSDDDGGREPKYVTEEHQRYRVGQAYELPVGATQSAQDQHNGDWVIWSTAPNAN